MAAPDEDRTKEALERVEREGREPGLGEVLWHELDLSEPHSAKASAERFIAKETQLDILSSLVSSLINYITSTHRHSRLVNNAAL